MNQMTCQITTEWQLQFRNWLEHDYRKFSPSKRRPSEKTVRAACQHVRVFSCWWEAKYHDAFEPSKVTNYDFHAYRQHSLDEARVAPDTWNSRMWALGVFCGWVELALGTSYSNLMDGIEIKKQGLRASRYRSLTDQEFGYLVHRLERRTREAVTAFEHWSAVRNQAVVVLMLFAGLRVEETSMLDLSDITINERSGSVRVRDGKGSKERRIPLNAVSRRVLSAWVNIRGNTTSYGLFVGRVSERLSARQIERIVSNIGLECHVPGASPHWLRYTFAKRLEKQGVPIEQIRELLGHESVETTKRYLRSDWSELEVVIERL